jgi:Ala-tRNA(Pro) deacylase
MEKRGIHEEQEEEMRPQADRIEPDAARRDDRGGPVMAVAKRLGDFLREKGIEYEVVPHPYTKSSSASAEAAHVDPDRLAKAIVVVTTGPERKFRLAVLPASSDIDVGELSDVVGENLELAQEPELARLFPDCSLGAVPAVGAAYDLQTVIDSALNTHGDVYFEAGDHQDLIRVGGDQFHELMTGAGVGSFSYPVARDEFRR